MLATWDMILTFFLLVLGSICLRKVVVNNWKQTTSLTFSFAGLHLHLGSVLLLRKQTFVIDSLLIELGSNSILNSIKARIMEYSFMRSKQVRCQLWQKNNSQLQTWEIWPKQVLKVRSGLDFSVVVKSLDFVKSINLLVEID